MKMFNLIDIGEHAGSGVPNIFNVWEDEGWEEPDIKEDFAPDRTSLTLKFIKKQAIKTSDKKQAIKTGKNMKKIRSYLQKRGTATASDIAELLGLSMARTRVPFYLTTFIRHNAGVKAARNIPLRSTICAF